MGLNLAVLAEDSVGPAVGAQELNVLQSVGERFDQSLNFKENLVGGIATDTLGKALSYETLCVIVGYAKVEAETGIIWNLI